MNNIFICLILKDIFKQKNQSFVNKHTGRSRCKMKQTSVLHGSSCDDNCKMDLTQLSVVSSENAKAEKFCRMNKLKTK